MATVQEEKFTSDLQRVKATVKKEKPYAFLDEGKHYMEETSYFVRNLENFLESYLNHPVEDLSFISLGDDNFDLDCYLYNKYGQDATFSDAYQDILKYKKYIDLEETVSKIVYEDTVLFESHIESFKETVGEMLSKISGKFRIDGYNMGWRNLHGYTEKELSTADDIINTFGGDYDFSLYLYWNKKDTSFRVVVYHHDSPMGEHYEAVRMD
jgi:hypothetical protein